MTMQGNTTHHLATLWQGEDCWDWLALKTGRSNSSRSGFHRWGGAARWTLHLTPIHLERDGGKWEIGLCIGRRTLYVLRHR